MRWRRNYLAVAALLTVLDAVVTVYYGTAAWVAWSGDIPACRLLVLLAAIEATSLANVWAQAGSSLHVRSEYAVPQRDTVSIPTRMRGQSNV